MEINQKQKIAIVIPDLRLGGAEIVTVNIINYLIELNYDVDLLLLSKQGELLEKLPSAVNIVDLNVKKVRHCLLPLIAYINQYHPQAMLVAMWPLTFIAAIAKLASKWKKYKLTVAEHTTWSRSELFNHPIKRLFARISMKIGYIIADNVITVSEGAKKDLAKFSFTSINKITKIYNPISFCGSDIHHSDETNKQILKYWKNAKYKLLSVGHLKKEKDYFTALKALSLLKNELDVCLVIVGEGALRTEIEQYIDKLQLNDVVSLVGSRNNTSLFYNLADCFVLSSECEGLPVVLIEALYFGLPIVSTNCPSGTSEVLCDGKYGKLVDIKNPEAMKEAIKIQLNTDVDKVFLKKRALDFEVNKQAALYLNILF